MFKKGDIVRVRGYVERRAPYCLRESALVHEPADHKYSNYKKRSLYRLPLDKVEGIVVGLSQRLTGWARPAVHYRGGLEYGDEYDAAQFYTDKRFNVVMVQPMHTQRYLAPLACLVEDVELVKAYQGGGGDE